MVMVEVWSDVVCPWCMLGKRRLEAALGEFPHADEVTVRWRSFQLDPSASVSDPAVVADHVGYLAAKMGRRRADAQAMLDQLTALAAEAGLEYHLEQAQGRSTADAHRLLHAAAAVGDGYALQGRLKERLLLAYLSEGRRIDDHTVLLPLAVEAGLDEDVARRVLATQEYAAEVVADQAEATALGAGGVPFFVIDRRYGVSGAQPTEVFAQALERAGAERAPVEVLAGGGTGGPGDGVGAACGPDGCAV